MGATVVPGDIAMAMVASEIERLIKQALPQAQVIIVDLAGDGDHFGARIISEAFKGKSRVQQHKMIYDALQGHMGGALHALALETSVPK
jgi:stress-induced morphogen